MEEIEYQIVKVAGPNYHPSLIPENSIKMPFCADSPWIRFCNLDLSDKAYRKAIQHWVRTGVREEYFELEHKDRGDLQKQKCINQAVERIIEKEEYDN